MNISARNRLEVTIASIDRGAVNAKLLLRAPQGAMLTAIITVESAEAMGLTEGEKVTAFFKASHVLVAIGSAVNISARNRLVGCVDKLRQGSIHTELIIGLGSGDTLSSIITNEALNELGIREGSEITAIIKASDVMIAKSR